MIKRGREGESGDLEEILCPLCGSKSYEAHLRVRDRLNVDSVATDKGPQESAYQIVVCSSCGFLYLNPRPKAEFLARFYPQEDYDPHRQSGGGWAGVVFRFVRHFTLRWKAARVSGTSVPGRLLDIGCGTGEFLAVMKQRGWDVEGIEQDEEAGKRAASYGVQVKIGDPADLLGMTGRYDLITLWHALEHLPQLQVSVELIVRALKPTGRLAIAVPNPESLDAGFYGARWAAWDAPRHLYHFRPRDIAALCEPHGLKNVQRYALPLDPFYHALLSETSWNRKPIEKVKAIRGLFIGMLSFFRGIHPEKASAVLYIFEQCGDRL